MGRFSLVLARGLKIVGGLLTLPLILFFFFLLPFGPPIEILTSSTVRVMIGLAVLGVLLLVLGKIIAPNEPWFEAKKDSEPVNPDGGAEEGPEFTA
jgi:hypothetical protein